MRRLGAQAGAASMKDAAAEARRRLAEAATQYVREAARRLDEDAWMFEGGPRTSVGE